MTEEEAVSGPFKSFRLPEGFASGGDPVDGNPFPPDAPRHRVWRDATRTAKLEVALISVDFFECMRRVEREKDAAEEAGGTIDPTSRFTVALADAQACHVSMVQAKFDAWAKRGTHVVWSDQQVDQNDRWLESFANDWIDLVSSQYARNNLPPRLASRTLLALRDALGQRVLFWMAEARRYQAEQEAQQSSSSLLDDAEATTSSGPSVSSSAQTAAPADIAEYAPSSEAETVQEPSGELVPPDVVGSDAQARNSEFSWQHVTIRFTSEHSVRITVGDVELPAHGYEELGFAYKTSKLPNRAWVMLRTLASQGGTLELTSGQWAPGLSRARKEIQELRKILRDNIKTDADPLPFKKGIGYTTAFKIDPGFSFD